MSNAEDISTYSLSFIQSYNNLVKTAATTYDFPENPPKKSKKWSIGNLFRRKKKVYSGSSSEDEINQNSFFNKRKCKSKTRKKGQKPVGAFDHIVMTNPTRTTCIKPNPNGLVLESGKMYYSEYPSTKSTVDNLSYENLTNCYDNLNTSTGSVDSGSRKSRKERTKARAVARRDSFQRGSSSEEDSQHSHTSSKFKSDESLMRCRDGSWSRRSRTARTERYNRRMKDDESNLNMEAFDQRTTPTWKFSEDEIYKVRSLSPRPTSIYKSSNFCTNNSSISHPNISGLFTIPPSQSTNSRYRFSSSNSLSKYQTNTTQPHIGYNENNMHRRLSPEIPFMHVKMPLGNYNYNNMPSRLKQHTPPPIPPPRDLNRIMQYENKRPASHHFNHNFQQHLMTERESSFTNNESPNLGIEYRTTSEDHISTTPRQLLFQRPSSMTNENRNRPLANHEVGDKFQYLTEKKPRSRKPIFIQSTDINYPNNRNSECESKCTDANDDNTNVKPSISLSPQIFTAKTNVQTKIFLPSVLNNDHILDGSNNQFKPISSPSSTENHLYCDTLEDNKHKSSNLEEALDELEAIYNSLHLGDEDLLERAEQREMALSNKLIDQYSRGSISDSSFSYEPYGSNIHKKKHVLKKSQTLNRNTDDMAFRKLNQYSTITTGNRQNNLATVSYLLTSPIHCFNDDPEDIGAVSVNNEPDVTLDDVVYRNLKHTHNTLKVIEPQPPFGIPVGHVIPAPNSDYLHAIPQNPRTCSYNYKKIPDVVKDDLAFRNLRKDSNKEPVLKLIAESNTDCFLKPKKIRAVRSQSANISNILHEEKAKYAGDNDNEFKNTKLSDIADAMEIAYKILKEKETKINFNKKAFLSDSESKYRKLALTSASSTETITDCRLNFLNKMRNNDLDIEENQLFNINLETGFDKTVPDLNPLNYETTATIDLKKSLTTIFTKDAACDSEVLIETKDRHTNSSTYIVDSVSKHLKLSKGVVETIDLINSLKPELFSATEMDINIADDIPKLGDITLDLHQNILSSDLDQDFEKQNNSRLFNEDNNIGAICKSPFEEHKADLIASFKELNISEEIDNQSNIIDEIKEYCGGEECVLEVFALPGIKECAYKSEANVICSKKELTYTTNCEIFIKNDECDSQRSFQNNSSCTESVCNENGENECSEISSVLIESLKSPKLVKTVMKREQQFQNFDVCNSNHVLKPLKQESNLLNNHSPSSSNNSRDLRHTLDKSSSCYGDPIVLVFACSYGVACSYQLASLDVVVILGLLFVIISISAALMLD